MAEDNETSNPARRLDPMKSNLFLVGPLRAESIDRRDAHFAEQLFRARDEGERFELADVPVSDIDLRGGPTRNTVVGDCGAVSPANRDAIAGSLA